MFYIDEMRLKSEYCLILNKLFILREVDSIPVDLTPFAVIDRVFTVQSLAILSQEQQQLLLKLLPAMPKMVKILRTHEPVLQQEAMSLLPTNQRAFLGILFEVGKNRGSYRAGIRDLDPKRLYQMKQDRAARVLAWSLRALGLGLHPDFPPPELTVDRLEQSLRRSHEDLVRQNPACREVLEVWIDQFDHLKFIALHETGEEQLSDRLYSQLSPESLILLLFLSRLIGHQAARTTKRAQERVLFRQEIVYIFTTLKILQDPANPPYGLSKEQALKVMFLGGSGQLDERARAFLAERKNSLPLYDSLLQFDDLPSFAREFAKLKMADQIFLSALQSIDKFYNEHGRFAPHDDYWYSRIVYNLNNLFYANAQSLPEVREQQEQTSSQSEGEERESGLLLRQSHIEEARKNTLLILEELGLIRDADHPTTTYDINTLCRGLFSEELVSHLPTPEAIFISDRARSIPLYQVLQHVSEEQQQKFLDSIKEDDAGFLMALRSLDDRFYDLDTEAFLDEDRQEETVQNEKSAPPQLLTTLENLKEREPELDREATPFAGVDRQEDSAESMDLEQVDSDPDATAQRVWAKTTTQGILRLLGLAYNFDGVECTECSALRTLLDELFTLENFVRLDKADQVFLLERKAQLPRFIEYVIEHDPKVKAGIYLTLEPLDQGFVAYVSALKYRKRT